jgi:hypothetical protein
LGCEGRRAAAGEAVFFFIGIVNEFRAGMFAENAWGVQRLVPP